MRFSTTLFLFIICLLVLGTVSDPKHKQRKTSTPQLEKQKLRRYWMNLTLSHFENIQITLSAEVINSIESKAYTDGIDALELYVLYVNCDGSDYNTKDSMVVKHGEKLVYHYIVYRCSILNTEEEMCRFRSMFEALPSPFRYIERVKLNVTDGTQVYVDEIRKFITCEYQTNRTALFLSYEDRINVMGVRFKKFESLNPDERNYVDQRYTTFLVKKNEKDRENDLAYRKSKDFHKIKKKFEKKVETDDWLTHHMWLAMIPTLLVIGLIADVLLQKNLAYPV